MKRSSLILLALLLTCVRAYAVELKDLGGYWAPKDYFVSVSKTGSASGGHPESVRFYQVGDKSWKLYWTSFHEATQMTIQSLTPVGKDVYHLELVTESAMKESLDLEISADQAGHVQAITFKKNQGIVTEGRVFERIAEPLNDVMRKQMLAGRYKDQEGHAFVLSESGSAEWPNKTFRYDISLDGLEADCDYLYRTDGPSGAVERYGYRRQGETLQLFTIAGGVANQAPIHCDQKPFTVLTPIPPTARDVVEAFYRDYLKPENWTPANKMHLPFSVSFQKLIDENSRVCKEKAGTDVCGWAADQDAYLNTQEEDPHLTYENSHILITEPQKGKVKVKLNVYPSAKNAGTYYDRDITFLMIQENGKWVVDDLLYGNDSTRADSRKEIDYYTHAARNDANEK